MRKPGKLTVLITGCSSGIGRALAQEFFRKNHVVFATARNIGSLDDIECDKGNSLCLDVTDEQSIQKAVKKVIDKRGRIDVLINNGGFGLMGPIIETPLTDFRKQFEANVVGPLALAQTVAPYMINQKWGIIVNMGSVSGILTSPFAGPYCGSKAALHSISDAMRMELLPFGINVITMQPGGILSKFGDNATDILYKIIKPDSLYAPILEHVKGRTREGQKGAMKAEVFAQKAVALITSKKPPGLIRLGTKSFSMPAYKWALPFRVIDKIMAGKFGLTELGR